METPKTNDFFVKRVAQAADNMLFALNNYSFEEAMSVLEWLSKRVEEGAVFRRPNRPIETDSSFPLRVPPRRRLIYVTPQIQPERKLP
ncbi:hypothetical protein [Trabulsiella odontotermitis]|uniref:hypothetical protein n=1 Tax=Trabulsiella odontotermitis TaxID=379893 RepID=UPI00092D3331|nr:hypothetical protein [Trabulsiella odontotermitis]